MPWTEGPSGCESDGEVSVDGTVLDLQSPPVLVAVLQFCKERPPAATFLRKFLQICKKREKSRSRLVVNCSEVMIVKRQ